MNAKITKLLGDSAASLLKHKAIFPKEKLHLPGPDFMDRVFIASDRKPQVLRSLQQMFSHGRLGGTGYLSILPVDQGIEHSAGASFAPNPDYFDPENIVKLAIEGGCNAVASTLGVLGIVARKYAHADSVHCEVESQRTADLPEQVRPDLFRARWSRRGTWGRWRLARRFISVRRNRPGRLSRPARRSNARMNLGLATVLWCYLRNNAFKTKEKDFHVSADLTGQANHLGVTIEADIIKQKLPENNGGYKAIRELWQNAARRFTRN